MTATNSNMLDATPEEKRQRRLDAWLSPDVEFATPEAAESYRARVSRLTAAATLGSVPDRVPVSTCMGFFPAWHAGLSPYDAMHDTQLAMEAWFQYNMEFQPDAAVSPALHSIPASALETLDVRNYSWPGHGVSRDSGYQYNEGEFMFPQEYDELIADPTFFLFRRALPRMIGAYEGLARLSTPHDMRALSLSPPHIMSWGQPEILESVERLAKAGREVRQWWSQVLQLGNRLKQHGFPDVTTWVAEAPFDVIGDHLRGTRGIMLDLYQRPEQVVEACDRMVDVVLRSVFEKTNPDSTPGVFMPLHKGLDAFMSNDHFQTFYWPSLKKVILGLIDEGFIPWLFTEGRYDSRLEIIKDLPKGKVVYWLNTTDIFKAKQVLGDVGCIQGNVPVAMMSVCGPNEVKQHCRELIDVVGKGGGYILDLGAGPDTGRAENVHALVRAAKEFGVY